MKKPIPREIMKRVTIHNWETFWSRNLVIFSKDADCEYVYNPEAMKQIVRELMAKAYRTGYMKAVDKKPNKKD